MFSFFKKKKEEKEKPKNLELIALCLVFEVANADNDINILERDLILKKIKESIDVSVLTEKEIFDLYEKNQLGEKILELNEKHEINKICTEKLFYED